MATLTGVGAVTSMSGQGSDSLDRSVRRSAGWFGVGGFVVFLVAEIEDVNECGGWRIALKV